jgi:hypothetical protein
LSNQTDWFLRAVFNNGCACQNRALTSLYIHQTWRDTQVFYLFRILSKIMWTFWMYYILKLISSKMISWLCNECWNCKSFVHIVCYMYSTIAVQKPQSHHMLPTQLSTAVHCTMKYVPTRQWRGKVWYTLGNSLASQPASIYSSLTRVLCSLDLTWSPTAKCLLCQRELCQWNL